MAATLALYLTGGADNSDPDASLGGVKSTTQLSETPLNNLFDDVDPSEAANGDTEYRALSLYNSGDASAVVVKLWFVSQTTSPDTAIWVGKDSGTQSIVNENTAPDNPAISWSQPTAESPLSIDDIAASAEQRLWFKRVVSASAANYANDTCEIAIRYA